MTSRYILIIVAALVFGGSAFAESGLMMNDLLFDGMTITVKSTGQALVIEPLASQQARATGKLQVIKPNWREGYYLPRVSWTYAAMTPGSLNVSTLGDSQQVFKEGKDYVVCNNWGTVGAVEDGDIKAGEELNFEFSYSLSRIDLIERNGDGVLTVKKGVANMRTPRVPEISEGYDAVFSVYLAHNTTGICQDNVNFITEKGKIVAKVLRAERIKDVLAKIDRDEPTTIVFLGDSITAQSDVVGGSFVDRFIGYLQEKYADNSIVLTTRDAVVTPADKEILVVKAGVGGNNSSQGLARIESDVLAHEPDLVFIMFGANDENRRGNDSTEVPLEQYHSNLLAMVKRIREVGGEPVIITPGMKNLGWVSSSGMMSDFAEKARLAAEEMDVCLVDVHDAWKRIPTVGSNYMIYLNSCINHPNHLGHELFFQGLKAAFE